nr:hypothetical protein [Bacilli bacterium]
MSRRWPVRIMQDWLIRLQIPEDVIQPTSRLLVLGHRQIVIDASLVIKAFHDHEIILWLDQEEVMVKGDRLIIETISQRQVVLRGEIQAIVWRRGVLP